MAGLGAVASVVRQFTHHFGALDGKPSRRTPFRPFQLSFFGDTLKSVATIT